MARAGHPREGRPVVFFDGVCGLCNGAVDWLMRRDRRGRLLFAPLQGQTALEELGPQDSDAKAWSLVLWDEDGLHDQSEAVFRALRHVGGPWSSLSLLRVVPRSLRDLVYRFIAERRYRWFGQRDTCRLPSPAEQARFLP